MAETIAESARKASAGSWRKPRMKIYDYNQVSFIISYKLGHIYSIQGCNFLLRNIMPFNKK